MSEENVKMDDDNAGEEIQNENIEEKEAAKKEDTIEDKYNELNDRFLRLYAEFDNFRRRTAKEKIDLINSASSGVLKEIIPVLDDFERAMANNETSQEINGIKEGMQLIYTKLKGSLENRGLKSMDTLNLPFDSELHEAIANVPVENKKQKGTVIDQVEKGYYLNDKVIRFAKVVVGQ